MKRLIVTADDLGLARQVNEAVEIAHRQGILTAASLMVGAPAAADAVARVRAMPSLRVGLHIVLVDGHCVAPRASVPDLVDESGRFRDNMVLAGIRMFADPRVRRQLAIEIAAQFAAFAATGLPLDHVNAHKHFHLHPTIAGLVLKIGQRFGMRAIRVPAEPRAVLATIERRAPSSVSLLTNAFARHLRAKVRRAGVFAPDHVLGLSWSGRMTETRLAPLLARLPAGVTEIYSHPATSGGFEGAAPRYRYADELDALIAPSVVAAVRAHDIRLTGYAALIR